MRLAEALARKAVLLHVLGRRGEALEVYDSVVVRFDESREPVLREHVARALFNKGATLSQLGRPESALEVYDSVVTRFGDVSEPVLREGVARALLNKGVTLTQLGHYERAIKVYESVVTRFGDASELPLREQVAMALVNKGAALHQLGHHERAIEVCENVVTRFGDASEPVLREGVVRALFNKGVTLDQLGHREQAIEVYDSVVTRFGDASEPALRELVALSLVNKSFTLGELGRHEQAIEVCENVVTRFGDASEPTLREQVAIALVNKGIALSKLGQHEQAIEVYESVVTRFANASAGPVGTGKLLGIAWNALGNLLLDRMGDPVRALAAYESGLTVDPTSSGQAILHANCAYALALHGRDLVRAQDHAQRALSDGESISPAGRHLLGALTCLEASAATRWPRFFEQIGLAVESGDTGLWSNYLDDLQRLISFAVAQGEGQALCRWMEQAQYPLRYAPLYHAIVAAIDGEDVLLEINPETRAAAARIHEGIARRLKLYGRADGRTDPLATRRRIARA